MINVLIERAEVNYCRSPLDTLALAEIAVSIAKQLDVREYPYDYVYKVRGQAFREQAYMLSYLGRLREAAAAAERSAECLDQIPVPPPELSRLDLVRSDIARNMALYEKAVSHARRAAENFLMFGDREGWLKARAFEAAALFESNDHRGALAVYRAMEKYEHLLDDRFRAQRLHNLAICAGAVREFAEAAPYFTRAAEAFDRLGLPVDGVKCRTGIGASLHWSGRHSEAVPVLRKASQEFEDLGMQGDAAYAALLLAECLLVLEQHDEVMAICRTLIATCTRAGMEASAMTALAFLRESIATGRVTPVHVRHVREFFEDRNAGGERPFAPPAPGGQA
jgi:tetratricopeptide (TPR) repeat protein